MTLSTAINGGGSGGGASARSAKVTNGATGVVATISTGLKAPLTVARDSGSTSITFAASGNKLTAAIASALAVGSSLSAIARVTQVDGAGVLIPVTLTGVAVAATVPAAPTVTLTAGDGQISIAWSDNSNGGAAITAHRVYVNGAGMTPTTAAAPVILTGVANGATVFIEVAAINSVGEGAKSTVQSATPSAAPSVGTFAGPFATLAGLGDSIMAGSSSTAPEFRHLNVFAVLAGVPGTPLNAGSGGSILQNSNQSDGQPLFNNGRDRTEAAVTGSQRQEAIIIALGRNDAFAMRVGDTNVANYITDYREVMSILLNSGYTDDKICIYEPYWQSDTMLVQGAGSAGGLGRPTRAEYEEYVNAARDIAAEFGVHLAPHYLGLSTTTYATTGMSSDWTHPNNEGHNLIAQVTYNQSFRPNTRARPASVGISVSGTTITVTASAVSGAVSYDYALIRKWERVATQNAAGTTATFTGVTALGGYRALVRAVFADGTKSPWRFSTRGVMPVPGTPFFFDDFNDADGTSIFSRNAPTGGAYAVQNGVTLVSANYPTVFNGRLKSNSTQTVINNVVTPPSANYRVDMLATFIGTTTEFAGVCARMDASSNTYYFARWDKSTNSYRLGKKVNGASSVNLTAAISANFSGGDRVLSIVCNGNQIWMEVDGVQIAPPVTDTDIPGPGRPGLLYSVVNTNTTGNHADTIMATAI